MCQSSNDGLHFFGSVHANHLVVLHLLANVNIGIEAVQNASCGGRVEGHEQERNRVGHQKHNQKGANGRVDLYVKLVEVDDQTVGNARVHNGNSKFAEQVENAANSASEHESCGVLQNKEESVDGCGAEAFSSQNDLTIRVLVDVLDKAVTAVESATDAVHDVLNWCDSSCGVHVFHLAVDVLENGSYHTNNCNNKRAKQYRTQVVSD